MSIQTKEAEHSFSELRQKREWTWERKWLFSPWQVPLLWTLWLRLDVFMWSWDVGESMVYAEAQKGSLQASRLVHVRGEGARGFGAVASASKTSGRPAVHTLHRPWGWWESDSLGSGVSSWRFWGPGLPFMAPRETCLWVQRPGNDSNAVLSFGWKPHTDPKGPDKLGGEKEHCPLLLSQPQALPSEALVSYPDGMFWQAEHRSVSLFSWIRNASLQVLCFLSFASSPSLVNICSLSKTTPSEILTRHAMLSKCCLEMETRPLTLSSVTQQKETVGSHRVRTWKKLPHSAPRGGLDKRLSAPRPCTLTPGCACDRKLWLPWQIFEMTLTFPQRL